MTAKKKTAKRPDSPTPVRIPPDLKEKLLKQAEKENRTLSNLIITACKQYLTRGT
jgi:predicted transcriptional regulator